MSICNADSLKSVFILFRPPQLLFLPLPWTPIPFLLPLPLLRCQLLWLLVLLQVAVPKNLLDRLVPLVLACLALLVDAAALLKHALILSLSFHLMPLHSLGGTSLRSSPSLTVSGEIVTESRDSNSIRPNWPSLWPAAHSRCKAYSALQHLQQTLLTVSHRHHGRFDFG